MKAQRVHVVVWKVPSEKFSAAKLERVGTKGGTYFECTEQVGLYPVIFTRDTYHTVLVRISIRCPVN